MHCTIKGGHSCMDCTMLHCTAVSFKIHCIALHSCVDYTPQYTAPHCTAVFCSALCTRDCTVLNQNTLHTVLNTGSCFTKMSDSTFDSSQKTRKPRWTSCRCTKKAEHRCKMHVPWCTYMVHHCVPWCTLHRLKAQKSWAVCIEQQG